MEIKKADSEDMKKLVPVLKEFFPVHAVFTKSDEEVFNYLKTFSGDIFVAVEKDEVLGGLALSWRTYGHKVAFFKHIAAKNEDKEVIKKLVEEAEKLTDAGKIEMHIAEGEKIPPIFFVEELGYELEGELKSHYRPGESCYIVGKVK